VVYLGYGVAATRRLHLTGSVYEVIAASRKVSSRRARRRGRRPSPRSRCRVTVDWIRSAALPVCTLRTAIPWTVDTASTASTVGPVCSSDSSFYLHQRLAGAGCDRPEAARLPFPSLRSTATRRVPPAPTPAVLLGAAPTSTLPPALARVIRCRSHDVSMHASLQASLRRCRLAQHRYVCIVDALYPLHFAERDCTPVRRRNAPRPAARRLVG